MNDLRIALKAIPSISLYFSISLIVIVFIIQNTNRITNSNIVINFEQNTKSDEELKKVQKMN